MRLLMQPPCLQASIWDVDGTGMQFIEDPDVDLGIRKVRRVQLAQPWCAQYWLCARTIVFSVS